MTVSEKRDKVLPAAMSAVLAAALCVPSAALADEAPVADAAANGQAAFELDAAPAAAAPAEAQADAVPAIDAASAAGEENAPAVASDKAFQGEGTESNPYILRSADDLVMLANKVNDPKPGEEGYASAHYRLTSDVDLSGVGNWVPIGNDEQHAFSGTFDGSFSAGGSDERHATIRNLSCSKDSGVAGLFGYVAGDRVVLRNLKFENVNIGGEGGPSLGGALAGSVVWKDLSSDMIKTTCLVEGIEVLSGSISGRIVGGIVGEGKETSIVMSSNFADVKSELIAGGIAGRSDAVFCCANVGSVWGGTQAGGITAWPTSVDDVMICYNGGDVRSANYAGGILGHRSRGTVRGCFNDGFVSAPADAVQRGFDAHMIGGSANNSFWRCYYMKDGDLYYLNEYSQGESLGGMTPEQLADVLNSGFGGSPFWEVRGDTVRPKILPETFDLCSVSLLEVEDGSVCAYPMRAEEGETITVSMTPDENKELEGLVVTSAAGTPVEAVRNADGTFRFAMPEGGAVVGADFGCDDGSSCPSAPFADVEDDAWYHDAVDWAIDRGILRGMGTTGLMEPDGATTRAQAVATIARIAGEDPAAARVAGFSDVPAGMWCEDVVSWGVANGIVEGYGDTGLFGPDDSVTREQLAVFLYRFAQMQGIDVSSRADLAAFSDAAAVNAWAADAVSWAVECGILRGVGDSGLLAPGDAVTRAQAATMLERFCASCGIEVAQL